jgi:hypothetical protein
MAANLGAYTRATPRASLFSNTRTSFIIQSPPFLSITRTTKITGIRVSNDGSNSYLDMWKTAVDRERKTVEFQQIAGNLAQTDNDSDDDDDVTVDLEKKSEDFNKILEVSKDERDRIQRVQVIDRAAAAIAAARDIVREKRSADKDFKSHESMGGEVEDQQGGKFWSYVYIFIQVQ